MGRPRQQLSLRLGMRTNGGQTALHLCAAEGRADCCALLIERGANLGAKDEAGSTAYDLAVDGGHGAVSKLLSEGKLARNEDHGVVRPRLSRAPLTMELVSRAT